MSSAPSRRATLVLGVLLAAVVVAVTVARTRRRDSPQGGVTAREARFVGRATCARCHEPEARAFKGSHHALAMQPATDDTVKGNFEGVSLDHFGVRYEFQHRDGKRFVRTEGPDGKVADFEARYTFGVDPLQQILVPLPGGRLQALSVAWDTRPKEQGGARWFHLYPNEAVPLTDELHWTGRNQSWNSMCAECHSTDLRKGYDAATDRYDTRYAEVEVSCEACHGPGSVHVAWAETLGGGPAPVIAPGFSSDARATSKGLVAALGERPRPTWVMDTATGIARRDRPPAFPAQVETCARCHSRRSTFSEDYLPGRPLLETHRPSLLEARLYHADGQIQDEVFEVGSFQQSRMYAAGVTCTDCHDPHSGKLIPGGPDATCAKCHAPWRFGAKEHHGHAQGSQGASCVACHMPKRTYMVVHERRDHSLRIPRPDLTESLGVPNACNNCHADRPASWARSEVERLASARGTRSRLGTPHYGTALAKGRTGAAGAETALVALAGDAAAPAIARATALSLLREHRGPPALSALVAALEEGDPLLRYGALQGLTGRDPRLAWQIAAPALSDPVRGVRVQAAHVLARRAGPLPPQLDTALSRALDEARAAERYGFDRPEGFVNLGGLETSLGNNDAARVAYLQALRLDPGYLPGALNYADFLRSEGKDADGERILREALARSPGSAELHHALGLNLVRGQRLAEALPELVRACDLRPDIPRFGYVLGVAQWSKGSRSEAFATLRAAHARSPDDRDLLAALVAYSEEAGDKAGALEWARRLVRAAPEDPATRQLLQRLEASAGGR